MPMSTSNAPCLAQRFARLCPALCRVIRLALHRRSPTNSAPNTCPHTAPPPPGAHVCGCFRADADVYI
eukprot:14729285-Alexandrium_andersonii.AAC.1